MVTALWLFHIVVAITLIVVVLLQPGQSGGMGTAFGGGGSQTVFGSGGGTSFMGRLTAVLGALFFINSLILAMISNQGQESVIESEQEKPPAQEAPATPGTGDAPPIPGTSPGERSGG